LLRVDTGLGIGSCRGPAVKRRKVRKGKCEEGKLLVILLRQRLLACLPAVVDVQGDQLAHQRRSHGLGRIAQVIPNLWPLSGDRRRFPSRLELIADLIQEMHQGRR
jgi:hypothetical protein